MRIIFILLTFLVLNITLFANMQTVQKEQKELNREVESKNKDYIPISEITKEASTLLVELKEMEEILAQSAEFKEMHNTLDPYSKSIEKLLKKSNYKNIFNQNIRELQKMEGVLKAELKQFQDWEIILNEHIEKYDKYKIILEQKRVLWKKSYENARQKSAPPELLVYIDSVLEDIKTLQKDLKKKYDQALTDSQLVSSYILRLNELIENIKKAHEIAINRVFFKNQASLFESGALQFHFTAYIKSIKNSLLEKYQESKNYFWINNKYWLKFFVLAFLSALFVFYYNYLYRKERLFVSKSSIGRKIFFFIRRPLSTYMFFLILIVVFVFEERPASLTEIVLIGMVLPIIRVLQTVIQKKYYRYLYTFFAIYIFYILNLNAVGFALEKRYMMLLINIALLVYLFRVLYKDILRFISLNSLYKIGKYLLITFCLLLLIALFANIYGVVLLSFRIVNGVIYILYASMIFYALHVILSGYIVVLLRRRISSVSHMLERYAQKIEKTTMYLIKIWMILWWLLIVSQQLSIYPYFVRMIDKLLAFSIEIGETTISLQAIVDFLMIIIATFILAKLIRVILEVEVFARFKLPRGAPTAIITTLNYVIIISGVFIAFSSLGVTPEQFVLLFGALGVGIGFGLRNIIANFISGIIMVFERPVQIGDTIEINKTMGSVQSIGARSSTIKTFDGSEVIIPNADFISKEIINWTLSDKHRRKIIEFRVDLDNDIEKIIKIMQDVVTSHKDVLQDPQPLATFKGFGEYYLEFKLYFWLSENLIVAQSDISMGIYKALKEAGIKMPVKKTNIVENE